MFMFIIIWGVRGEGGNHGRNRIVVLYLLIYVIDSYRNESYVTCKEVYSIQLCLIVLLTSSSSVVASRYFGPPTVKSDRHKINEILLKVRYTNNVNLLMIMP